MENNLKKRLAAGEVSLCMGLRQSRTVDIGPLVGAAGFDCLYVDMEHSPIGFEATSAICITAVTYGVTPLVRVPAHQAQDISRALDGGAQGVILPHVNTPDQARAIVAAAKYPPIGHRSVMGAGPATAYKAMPLAKVNESGNAETMVIIMLETPEGIANADAIAAIAGVDMLLIGSNDLCTEMGIPGQLRHPSLLEAYQTVAAACARHGVALGHRRHPRRCRIANPTHRAGRPLPDRGQRHNVPCGGRQQGCRRAARTDRSDAEIAPATPHHFPRSHIITTPELPENPPCLSIPARRLPSRRPPMPVTRISMSLGLPIGTPMALTSFAMPRQSRHWRST